MENSYPDLESCFFEHNIILHYVTPEIEESLSFLDFVIEIF